MRGLGDVADLLDKLSELFVIPGQFVFHAENSATEAAFG
jgi:hypothetical protein